MSESPITYRSTIDPWQCDHVGHLNVMGYVGKFHEATWQFFNLLGLTPSFLRSAKRGMATVDQQGRANSGAREEPLWTRRLPPL